MAICTLLKGHQHSGQAGPQSFNGTAEPDSEQATPRVVLGNYRTHNTADAVFGPLYRPMFNELTSNLDARIRTDFPPNRPPSPQTVTQGTINHSSHSSRPRSRRESLLHPPCQILAQTPYTGYDFSDLLVFLSATKGIITSSKVNKEQPSGKIRKLIKTTYFVSIAYPCRCSDEECV
ncbi:hypothetical protein MTP99_013465 [Tenebrio molitor]|jgi:hypothetical protein|nr:hypothetical protein MTP99_013465 [Tenebrio molitor]